MTPRTPPEGLGATALSFWRSIVDGYELENWAVDVVTVAACALDTHEKASEVLSREGLTYTAGNLVRPRPEVAIARDARVGFLRAVRELRLEVPDSMDGSY